MEALGGQRGERAERPAAVAAEQPVGVVLDHRRPDLGGRPQDVRHLAPDPGVVHRHDRPRAATQQAG